MSLSDRIGQFTAVPNWVLEMMPEIGMDGLAMYAYLLMRQGENGQCFPAYDRMQKDLGAGRGKIAKTLTVLVAAGLVTKKRRFSASTVYSVISTKTELMQCENRTNEPPISPKIELPLVPKSNSNKTHLTRLDKSSSSEDSGGFVPGPLALLNDQYINTARMPAYDNTPRNVEAGQRMIAAGVTPEILEVATKELLANGFNKLTGLASVEKACGIEIGKRRRKIEPKEEHWAEVHK